MKWQDHLDKIDEEYPLVDPDTIGINNYLDFMTSWDMGMETREQADQKVKEDLGKLGWLRKDGSYSLSDLYRKYEDSGGAWKDEDEFIDYYSGNDEMKENREFATQGEMDKWLNETSEEHPDMFRRAEFNKNHNSLYFYDKDGNKHRVSTHLANTNNGENVYDWMVDDYNDIPSKAEEIIDGKANLDNGKFGSLRSVEHSRLKSGGSNLYETPKTIIPYDQLKNYKNQEDTFEADEDRQEEDSNNLSKKEITKYE